MRTHHETWCDIRLPGRAEPKRLNGVVDRLDVALVRVIADVAWAPLLALIEATVLEINCIGELLERVHAEALSPSHIHEVVT